MGPTRTSLRRAGDEGPAALHPRRRAERTFDGVYARERLAVVRLAYLLVRSIPVAEELAQEAFVRLYQQFDEVENPAGFLRTVVVRLALTSLRRQQLEQRKLATSDPVYPVGEPHLDETWQALGRLTSGQRAVLVLRFYEDLSHEQIGRLLGCSTGAVRNRTARALAQMRKEMGR